MDATSGAAAPQTPRTPQTPPPPPETFAGVVRARRGDHHVGLRFQDQSWTWDEVVREGAARAALLKELVAEPLDRQRHVGVLLENVPDFVFWLVGGVASGAVVVGINAQRSAAELATDIRHADVDLIVTESRLAHLLTGDHGVPVARVLDVDDPRYRRLLEPYAGSDLPADGPRPEDLALLLFSSGSTGAPKAVKVGQGRWAGLTDALVERTRMHRDSVAYLCMPLFHGNAVMLNLGTALRVGATVALTRRFSAHRFSDDVHRHGATFVNYVGRALSYVLMHPADPRDADSTLELAFGTEASEADAATFARRFGCDVVEGYGMSEGVFRIGRTPTTPPGALGVAAGGVDVRVLDEATGRECPPAQLGEGGRLLNPEAIGQLVAIGGAASFEGYWKNPEATAQRVRGADFWSGDLAYRDADGFFWFAGRSSDWLRVDGENFAAGPVERVLQRAPGVVSAVVYGVPDPVTGDQVMAAVELDRGATFEPEAFAAFLAAAPEMGAKWWPRMVRVTQQIPLTASNKVDKGPLRREAWRTTDPVWLRADRTTRYRPLTADDVRRIEQAMAEHGRASLLAAP